MQDYKKTKFAQDHHNKKAKASKIHHQHYKEDSKFSNELQKFNSFSHNSINMENNDSSSEGIVRNEEKTQTQDPTITEHLIPIKRATPDKYLPENTFQNAMSKVLNDMLSSGSIEENIDIGSENSNTNTINTNFTSPPNKLKLKLNPYNINTPNNPKPIKKKPLSRKKADAIFTKFSHEEKKKILYDKIDLGINNCERKYGVNHKIIGVFNKNEEFFQTDDEKDIWMGIEKETIRKQMDKLDKHTVIRNIENILNDSLVDVKTTIEEIYDMSFNRGLGIVAARFSINLFELEFILKEILPERWADMVKNCWYCVTPYDNYNKPRMSKLDMVKLSDTHGILYASKHSGKPSATICKYRKLVKEKGPKGLDDYYLNETDLISEEMILQHKL